MIYLYWANANDEFIVYFQRTETVAEVNPSENINVLPRVSIFPKFN